MKRFMHMKSTVAAVAVSGGVAALLFGGSAVSTAFSSDSAQNVTVAGATVNGTVTNGSFAVTGLLPGGPSSDTQTISFQNTGNTTEAVILEMQPVVAANSITGVSPNLADLNAAVTFTNTFNGDGGATTPQQATFNLGGYPTSLGNGQALSVTLGTLPAGASATAAVSFSLVPSAGNSWNGASITIPYTAHFQDTSGSDGTLTNGLPTLVPTSNS